MRKDSRPVQRSAPNRGLEEMRLQDEDPGESPEFPAWKGPLCALLTRRSTPCHFQTLGQRGGPPGCPEENWCRRGAQKTTWEFSNSKGKDREPCLQVPRGGNQSKDALPGSQRAEAENKDPGNSGPFVFHPRSQGETGGCSATTMGEQTKDTGDQGPTQGRHRKLRPPTQEREAHREPLGYVFQHGAPTPAGRRARGEERV